MPFFDIASLLNHYFDIASLLNHYFGVTTKVDLSITIKFVYIHWIGDEVPFAKRGKFNIVHGSAVTFFEPFHVDFDITTKSEISETLIRDKVEMAAGNANFVRSGNYFFYSYSNLLIPQLTSTYTPTHIYLYSNSHLLILLFISTYTPTHTESRVVYKLSFVIDVCTYFFNS